jgi:hypothetical protein
MFGLRKHCSLVHNSVKYSKKVLCHWRHCVFVGILYHKLQLMAETLKKKLNLSKSISAFQIRQRAATTKPFTVVTNAIFFFSTGLHSGSLQSFPKILDLETVLAYSVKHLTVAICNFTITGVKKFMGRITEGYNYRNCVQV